MNIHIVTERLIDKDFSTWDFSELQNLYKKVNESNLKIWKNDRRVVVIKNYSSKSHFQEWREDHIPISYLYDILEAKYRNNLYFLIILDWGIERSSELTQLINMVEKDELVCRKYVIIDNEDLERVPFLQELGFDTNKIFNYEQTFRENLENQNKHSIIMKMINHYFSEEYLNENKDEQKIRLTQLIEQE